MRVTTLKGSGAGLQGLLDYYGGLADDQARRDGVGRGPIDYYLDPAEPPGRWWGGGRETLGLGSEVQPREVEALLLALHPVSGARLGRAFGDRSARAFDATFSAPKSVSLLWALSDDAFVRAEVLAAHDAAVEAALGWFACHGAVTRRGRDGVHQVNARGVVVAMFRQHTSRSTDPQLHTHALVASKVQDGTGRWLSLDARFLKRQQRSIGWIYAAALRSELSARLKVAWGPMTEGHADVAGVPASLTRAFSTRSAQVDARLKELVGAWMTDHDGAEPDARTLYRLERRAALESRPGKGAVGDLEALRAQWHQQPAEVGVEKLDLPVSPPGLPGMTALEREAIVTKALERVAADSATWLHADLAREIATLVPAGTAASGAELVKLIEDLASSAAERCVEIYPVVGSNVPVRYDGQALTEHVVDRHLTTTTVLDQEARLLRWARSAVGAAPRAGEADIDEKALAARAVSGEDRLVLVVGPAGAGKTTLLGAAARALAAQGRRALGLAPSGKAADVLASETDWPATTLAKLLYEHHRFGGPDADWVMPAGTTVVLDEAGMAGTDDVDALVALVQQHGWRLVCVGDPAQLPAVRRGGMFELWCETLPAHHLESVRRFDDDWQAETSLVLRRGDPAAAAIYAAHHRLYTVHPALLADRVARQRHRLTLAGESVAITTASAGTARAINVEIQRRRNPRLAGHSVLLADGTAAFCGDRVATRRNAPLLNSAGSPVRNRQTWSVETVGDDGSLVVSDPDRGTVTLPDEYVARHVELGWAVTGYGNQGVTTDHGICVLEPSSTRAGVYVAMTRGWGCNVALMVDRNGLADAEDAFAVAIARPAGAHTAHAVRTKLGGEGTPLSAPSPPDDDRARCMARRLDQLQAVQRPARVLRR